MISLFLDTSYKNLIISIFKDENILYHFEVENNNDLSIKLLKEIENAFNSLNIDINELNKIYVIVGPGSFTGVRIGVTAAKVIAWALDIKVVQLSEIELLATSKTDKKYIVPLMDARRGFVYTGMYDKHLKKVIEDKYISLEEMLKNIEENYKIEDVEFVSYDTFDMVSTTIPKVDVSKLINKHIKTRSVSPHIVVPNYLKKTEAEENLKHD